MKNGKKCALFLAAMTSCFIATSCSDDDGAETPIDGTYAIALWISPVGVDLNGDGNASQNLALEGDCYSDWTITLNSNGTYTATADTVTADGETISCQDTVDEGNWSRSGELVALNSTVTTGSKLYSYSDAYKTLSISYVTSYPVNSNSGFAFQNGTVTLAYQKE